ncbi:hypothetical protein MF271_05230 [Deinococcus sp. KNUC1210]|uniref:hypothetical protein n=1 Tax=Deinococcus sp. KNUC1210 TaxID=2917691 RepID=UPI001EEFE3D6|nr:hypothetical protein [Deinococcus sp. KNUC1210]ULH16037.1 hypothetical protein MF271_05230 [Deinococcus sp. KNUC1210]
MEQRPFTALTPTAIRQGSGFRQIRQVRTAFAAVLDTALVRVAVALGWNIPQLQLAAGKQNEGSMSAARPIDFDDVLRGFSSDL